MARLYKDGRWGETKQREVQLPSAPSVVALVAPSITAHRDAIRKAFASDADPIEVEAKRRRLAAAEAFLAGSATDTQTALLDAVYVGKATGLDGKVIANTKAAAAYAVATNELWGEILDTTAAAEADRLAAAKELTEPPADITTWLNEVEWLSDKAKAVAEGLGIQLPA